MLENLSLDGKTIVITGGGTGLGKEMTLAMARAGADLVIAARRVGPIEEVAALVMGLGRRALAIPTDVTDSAQVARLFDRTLVEFGKVDVLINNAGLVGGGGKPIWEITDETWKNGIDGNLTSAFYCARAISKHMVDRGQGKIVNMASGYGLRGGKDTYIYSSAKGAVINFTRSLATSLGRYGVTSNCIAPGFVPTSGTEESNMNLPQSPFIPIGRAGRPTELGPIAVFLASGASDYMNGELLVIDGGGLAGGYAPTGYAPEIPLEV